MTKQSWQAYTLTNRTDCPDESRTLMAQKRCEVVAKGVIQKTKIS